MRLESGQVFGEYVRARAVANLTLVESRYQRDERLPTHSHERDNLCLVLRGNFEERFNRRERTVRAPALLFRPAGERHAQRFSLTGATCLTIELGSAWSSIFRLPKDGDTDLRGDPTLLAFRLYAGFRQVDEGETWSGGALSIEERLIDLLGCAASRPDARTGGTLPRWLVDARDRLHSDPTSSWLITEMAQTAGVHPVYFTRRFHRTFGCTVTRYVWNLRMARACHELIATSKPVSRIALDLGYSDQSHFGRVFRALLGCTPAQYRLHAVCI